MLTLLLLFTAPAVAGPLPIDGLQVEHDGGTTHVHYALPASAHAGLNGPLGLELRIRDASGVVLGEFAAPVTEARGKATFTLPKGMQGQEAEVWLTVGGVLAPLQVGGLVMRRVTLEPQSGPLTGQVATQDWSMSGAVIEACSKVFSSSARQESCLQHVKASPVDPGPTIAACAEVADADEAELTCLSHLAAVSFDPVPAIKACAASMDGDPKELACIRFAAMAPADPTEMIQSCDKARSGDDAELECIEARVSGS